MLNVNTIEFQGRKAVINSFSDHPALANDIVNQIAHFKKLFPNATVQTERLSEHETRAMVAADKAIAGHLESAVWMIGEASNGKA